jgi:transcriptional regulator with XRE-family HTH domain
MSIAPDPGTRIPPSTLSVRLVLAREWRGYTQDELADVLDVSRATISNYERGVGKRGISRLQVNAWAAFCDVDVEWLKTGVTPENVAPGPSEVSGKITNVLLAFPTAEPPAAGRASAA